MSLGYIPVIHNYMQCIFYYKCINTIIQYFTDIHTFINVYNMLLDMSLNICCSYTYYVYPLHLLAILIDIIDLK